MSTILFLLALLAAPHSVSSEVCPRKLDVVFTIDGSASICGGAASCPAWVHCLQFIKNIVSSFNIGPDATRVAIVTVSSVGNLAFGFEQNTNMDSLLLAIDDVPYPGGEEIVSVTSIKDVLTSIIVAATSQRSDATFFGILISDGAPNLNNLVIITTSTALQALGMNAFVVCVTPRCPADLARSTSSPPKQLDVTYFLVNDYSSIESISDKVAKQICSFKGTGVLGAIAGGVSSIIGF